MPETHTVARSLHDLGLAAWFGGSLMGAVGVNGGGDMDAATSRYATSAWDRWTPVNVAAVGAHLLGGTVLTATNKGRLAGQKGVGTAAVAKTVLTAAALGASGYARMLGRRIDAVADTTAVDEKGNGAQGASARMTARAATENDDARARRQLRLLQWTVPALTGAVLILNAKMGEQQRPRAVAVGFLRRLFPWR